MDVAEFINQRYEELTEEGMDPERAYNRAAVEAVIKHRKELAKS